MKGANNKLIEKLASLMHDIWSEWQNHQLSQASILRQPQTMELNYHVADFEKWDRQRKTPYNQLSKKEQESDIKLAKRILNLIEKTD